MATRDGTWMPAGITSKLRDYPAPLGAELFEPCFNVLHGDVLVCVHLVDLVGLNLIVRLWVTAMSGIDLT